VAKGGHHVIPCPPVDRAREQARWAELRGEKFPLHVRVPSGKTRIMSNTVIVMKGPGDPIGPAQSPILRYPARDMLAVTELTPIRVPGLPPGAGTQDLIHGDHPWDHSSEPLGQAQEINGIWNDSLEATDPPSSWDIVNTNLMIPGTKQWRTSLVKSGSGQWRVERSEAREPRTTQMINVSGGHKQAPQKLWHGWLMRIDEAVAWNKGHWIQWHGNSSLGGGLSPFISITGRTSPSDGLEVRMEAFTEATYHSGTLPELTEANVIGITHAYIFEILWDSRTNAQGNTGYARLYLDDDPVPIWALENERNCILGDLEHRSGNGVYNVPYFKYGLYKSNLKTTGSDGDTYTQNYQNYCVHGENANRQGVLDSLRWDEVTG